MDRLTVESWIESYIKAWTSNNVEDISTLWSEGALYFTGPFDAPWRGRDEIVSSWLARKDDPGTWQFSYEVLATEADLAVVRGSTLYPKQAREYSNIWVIHFDGQNRATEFTEWWVAKK